MLLPALRYGISATITMVDLMVAMITGLVVK